MAKKTFELTKGKGKSKAVNFFEVKSEEDIKTLGMFLYMGWKAKEITKKKEA